MLKTTRSIANAALESAKMFGVKYVPVQGTTLNEYYEILTIPTDDNTIINYVMLGIDGLTVGTRYPPTATNLVKPLPLFSKHIGIPYTEEEDDRFKLKKIVTGSDGQQYRIAYALNITASDNISYLNINKEIELGVTRYSLSRMTDEELANFTPLLKPMWTIADDASAYVGHSLVTELNLTETDIENINIATDLVYPDTPIDKRRLITDIGFIQGRKGLSNNIVELAEAQLAFTIQTSIELDGTVISRRLEIGGLYPQKK